MATPHSQLLSLSAKARRTREQPISFLINEALRNPKLINLAAGGTLYQDLKEQYPGSIKHDYFPFGGRYSRDHLAHEVRIVEQSRLADILGAGSMKVNSMHHQGIRSLGEGLVASATAPDGLIEGLESADASYLVAVQWHPEVLSDGCSRTRQLFSSFIDAASAWSVERTRVAGCGERVAV